MTRARHVGRTLDSILGTRPAMLLQDAFPLYPAHDDRPTSHHTPPLFDCFTVTESGAALGQSMLPSIVKGRFGC